MRSFIHPGNMYLLSISFVLSFENLSVNKTNFFLLKELTYIPVPGLLLRVHTRTLPYQWVTVKNHTTPEVRVSGEDTESK